MIEHTIESEALARLDFLMSNLGDRVMDAAKMYAEMTASESPVVVAPSHIDIGFMAQVNLMHSDWQELKANQLKQESGQ